MTEKKIKVVTLTIEAKKLYNETEKALTFKSGKSSRFTTIAKSQIFNFEKVETYFPSWKGRVIRKAYKFQVPLWLFEKNEHLFKRFMDSIIIENTHKP